MAGKKCAPPGEMFDETAPMPGLEEIWRHRAWREMGLKDEEYGRIVGILGRPPNWTELGMFAVMWSEHCAYKHSKKALKAFPTSGPRILLGPGENAGICRLDERWAVVWKEESHNHPSAIEPFQGAATGVGGIVRDILAMGARPVALLDSLRFGPLSDPRQRYLADGVISGIAAYGNCIGVPTVGGELLVDECYSSNPLVNVTCVGLVEIDKMARGVAAGVGNPVFLVGSSTGRDGIHGCTFASEELDSSSEERRPAVQVGDPFMEKLLIEACLEMLRAGCVVGIQDMGAAGITSSCSETASRAGTGMEIWLDRVPLREEGMNPYEIMLSESQERMLVIADREKAAEVRSICNKWGLNAAEIGVVTGDGMIRAWHRGAVVAEVPARALTEDAPVYDPPEREPSYLASVLAFDPGTLPEPESREELERALEAILASPDICSKEWVYSQYDHMVQTGTVVLPGSDAAVIRVKEAGKKGIALSTDGDGRLCYLDPYLGGAAAVAEAARNVVCAGAEPVGITNCLNFGNPEKPEVMWQFRRVVQGMAAACRALGTPVTGGNVSFYNESPGRAIYPTPVVGMLGILDDIDRACTSSFKALGDVIAMIGPLGGSVEGLGGSQYLKVVHGKVAGLPPRIDLDLEARVQKACLEMIRRGILNSAHDCSGGGLGVALAECCFPNASGLPDDYVAHFGLLGAEVDIGEGYARADAALFSEEHSRIVVSVSPGRVSDAEEIARRWQVPFRTLGRVIAEPRLKVTAGERTLLDLPVERAWRCWRRTLSWLVAR